MPPLAIDLSTRVEGDLVAVHTDVAIGETQLLATDFFTVEDEDRAIRGAGMATLSGMGRVRLVRGFYDQ